MSQSALVAVFIGTINSQSIQLCNARDLHSFLQVKRDYTTWIKARIAKFGFIDGEDYLLNKTGEQVFTKSGENLGGRPSSDYHLTLDMAKELSMVENNEQGKAARRYFIELERKIKSELPRNPAPALPNKTITPAQQRELQEAVSKKALSAPIGAQRTSFKTIWGSIKSHFHVGTYKDLSESQFNSAVEFVENFHWELLDAPKAPVMQAPSKRYEFPKEMLFQDYFCGKNEDGSLTLPKLDLHTFSNANFSSPMEKLLSTLHDDGHNIDAPYAEFMAMRFGIKRVSEQLGALFALGSDSGNATLKIICRR